jgi:hypothetical protein
MATPALVTARANSSLRSLRDKTDGRDGEKRSKIEERERGSTTVGSFISKGSIGYSDLS